MTHFRHAAIAAALLAGVGTASAQTTVITREPVETRTIVTTQPLALTPVQRHTIYRTIVREPVETAPADGRIPCRYSGAAWRAAL